MSIKKRQTLLEKILERRVSAFPIENLSDESRDEAEVIIAWILGKVDSSEACAGLKIKSTSQIATRAGTVMRNLGRAQFISIVWNKKKA
jgi:hypothetical protein